MVSMPLISIAIPTYNRAEGYLRETLHSAVSQSYPEIEIIVSDNCSADNTEQIVRDFKDSRINYFRQSKNIGRSNNLNFCLDQARGEYFLLLPDDDLIDKDFTDVCIKAVDYNTNFGIIRTGTRIINHMGAIVAEFPNRVVGLSTLDFFLGWFSCITAPYMCSTLLNTIKLKEMGGYRSKHNLFSDVGAAFKLAAKYGRTDIIDVKASFRKHSDAITYAARVGDWCEDSLELLDSICDLIPGEKEVIRVKGMPFLAYLNYNRAMAVRSTWKRLAAYFIVFTKFGFRFLPTRSQLTHKI